MRSFYIFFGLVLFYLICNVFHFGYGQVIITDDDDYDVLQYTTTVTITNYAYKATTGQLTLTLPGADMQTFEETMKSVYASLGSLVTFDSAQVAKIIDSTFGDVVTISVPIYVYVPLIPALRVMTVDDIYNQLIDPTVLDLPTFNSNLPLVANLYGAISLTAANAKATDFDNSPAIVTILGTDVMYFTTSITISGYSGSILVTPQFKNIVTSTMSSVFYSDPTGFNAPDYVECDDIGTINGNSLTITISVYVPQEGQYGAGSTATDQYNLLVNLVNAAFTSIQGLPDLPFTTYLQSYFAIYDDDGDSGLSSTSAGTLNNIGTQQSLFNSLSPAANPTLAPFVVTSSNTLAYTNYISISNFVYDLDDFGQSNPYVQLTPGETECIEAAVLAVYTTQSYDDNIFSGGSFPTSISFKCSSVATIDTSSASNGATITIIAEVTTIVPLTGDFLNMAVTDIYDELIVDLTTSLFNVQLPLAAITYDTPSLANGYSKVIDFSVTDVVINDQTELSFPITIQVSNYNGDNLLSAILRMDLSSTLTAAYFVGNTIPFNAPYYITVDQTTVISGTDATIVLTTHIPQEGLYALYTYDDQYSMLELLVNNAFTDTGNGKNFFSLLLDVYAVDTNEISSNSIATLLNIGAPIVFYVSPSPTLKPSSGPPVPLPTSVPISSTQNTLVYKSYIRLEQYSYVVIGQKVLFLSESDIAAITAAYYGVYGPNSYLININVEQNAVVIESGLTGYVTLDVIVDVVVPLTNVYITKTVFDIYNNLISQMSYSKFNTQLALTMQNSATLQRAYASDVDFTAPDVNIGKNEYIYTFDTTITISKYTGTASLDPAFQSSMIATMTTSYLGLDDSREFDIPYYITCSDFGEITQTGSDTSVTVVMTTHIPQEGPYAIYPPSNQSSQLTQLLSDAFADNSVFGTNAFSFYLHFYGYLGDNYYDSSGISSSSNAFFISNGPYVIPAGVPTPRPTTVPTSGGNPSNSDSSSGSTTSTKKSLNGGAVFGIVLLILVFLCCVCIWYFNIDVMQYVDKLTGKSKRRFINDDSKEALSNPLIFSAG